MRANMPGVSTPVGLEKTARPRIVPLARGADPDDVMSSLCRFDLLACLVAIDAAGSTDTRNWYTHFARFYTTRSEPAARGILTDNEMRAVLFHGKDDKLAEALRAVNELASSEAWSFAGWDGFEDPTIVRFLGKWASDPNG